MTVPAEVLTTMKKMIADIEANWSDDAFGISVLYDYLDAYMYGDEHE